MVAVTESDTQNSSNATNYTYSYDEDGRLLTSRMAPGDLGPFSPGANSGALGNGVRARPWLGRTTAFNIRRTTGG